MKKICLVLYLMLFVLFEISAQLQKVDENNIKELIEIKWNTDDGIFVQNDLSGRYGLAGFEIINENEMAALCSFEKKVKIFNIETGLLSYQFEIFHPVGRFTYDSKNQKFYISADFKIYEYSLTGDLLNQFDYSRSFLFISKIKVVKGSLYLLTSNNKTNQLTINGIPIPVNEQKSTMIEYGIWDNSTIVRINSVDKHNFNIVVNNGDFDYIDTHVNRSDRIGSVYLIGKVGLIYYIMLENIVNADPIKTIRKVLLFSGESKSIVKEIEIPNICFTNLHHDFKVRNGNLFHLLTTPEKAILIKICTDSILSKSTKYPDKYNYEYHYNIDNSNYDTQPGANLKY